MTSRKRIEATIAHREPDKLPVDFGGGFQTGIHVTVVYQLRQKLGLDAPGTPVKVTEVYQMLGEIAPDLAEALGIDTVALYGTGTMFGFPARDFKEWTWHDGTPILVPVDFNTEPDDTGYLYQYPEGDRSAPASGKMPPQGDFFDAIVRQPPMDEDGLDPSMNCEEFGVLPDSEFDCLRQRAEGLHAETDRALFMTFGGLTFGDIALVPAVQLKNPQGIRDLQEWYISTVTRPNYIKAVFERQSEIAIANLEKLHAAVGDKPTIIQTNGTDFGTQNGPFLSVETYQELFLPYQKKVNGWIHRNTSWKTLMHCCGGIRPLLDSVVEAEFDCLNPVQCSAAGMDAGELKKQYGDQLVFWGGGVDTQKTLPYGTPDEVRDQVRRRVDTLAPGGGFVFCTIHNIVAKVPTKNVLAMFDAIGEYR